MRLIQLKQIAGGGFATGVPNAAAFFNGSGSMTSVPQYLAGALDAFSRPAVRDFRLGPGGRGAVYKLGAWGVDGDPQNVTSEGYVTYGANALGLGPDGTQGGFGFYEPNGFGELNIIPGVNGGNAFYICGFEDGSVNAPFGLDGFIVNDNTNVPIAWIKRSDNTSSFRTVTTGLNGTPAKWSAGAVVPNGTVLGSPGDVYSNTSGGMGTTLWAKESGVATNTGWAPLRQSSIYWQAGTPWADIRAQIIAMSPMPGPIYLDVGAPYVAGVAAEVTNLHGMWFQMVTSGQGAILQIADGAQLRNLGGVSAPGGVNGVSLLGNRTGGLVTLDWDAGADFMSATTGGYFGNQGSAPLVDVAPGVTIKLELSNSSLYAGGTAAVINLGATVVCFVTLTGALPNAFPANWITGGGTTTLVIQNTGGFDFNQVASWAPGFTGVVHNVALDLQGGTGPTAYRPSTYVGPLGNGTQYFDTTLGYPIWWNVSLNYWVNAAGVGPQ